MNSLPNRRAGNFQIPVCGIFTLLWVISSITGSVTAEEVDLNLPEGFVAERLYEVPNRQGSWVSLTHDPKGRLIASDQYGGLYRIDASSSELQVEALPNKIGFAQGLLHAFGHLYVVSQKSKFKNSEGEEKEKPGGLYRLTDTNGDDQYDTEVLLRKITGRGEHGAHAVILSPDKKSLYICAGNHTDIPEPELSRVPRVWQEDQATPRLPDPRGHANGMMAPGGWICKTDPDGKKFEMISSGYLNQYDIAFDRNGELFTFDADMEWDIGLPWYRPTRVCHATSGSEFGWRHGSGKWPAYFADSLPAVANIGPGSPTGICFGTNSKFPADFQNSLFIGDWSYGIIYRVEMEQSGGSYRGESTTFCTSPGLPVTDLIINPFDGAMYFLTGGRRSQSAMYRVTFSGESKPVEAGAGLNDVAQLRRKLESLHATPDDSSIVEQAWPQLSHSDRFVRFAARTALELANDKSWYEKAFAESDTQAKLEAVMAVVRSSSDAELQDKCVTALSSLDFKSLDEQQQLHLLRDYGLVLSRMDNPTDQTLGAIRKLDSHFPTDNEFVNRELARVLAAANSSRIVELVLDQLDGATTQESQVHYAMVIHAVESGWTDDLRQRYLQWFANTGEYAGGNSFRQYLESIRTQFAGGLTDEQRQTWNELVTTPLVQSEPYQQLGERKLVQKWTLDDFTDTELVGRDLENGKQVFVTAQCANCHALKGDGGIVGPELTNAGRRFNFRDLLETIIDPDKEVSDQYQATVFQLDDGRVISGRVANRVRNQYRVQEDMMRPSQLTTIKVEEIEEMRPATKSLMPGGLLDTFTREEVLDLMAYLRSTSEKAQ